MDSPRIIGGMFGLEFNTGQSFESRSNGPRFLTLPHHLLATARSAFTLLGRLIRPQTMWFPSYLCDVVLAGLDRLDTTVRFYPIDGELAIESSEWLGEVG